MELFYGEYAGHDVDAVITTRELIKMIRSAHISPDTLEDIKSDAPMQEGDVYKRQGIDRKTRRLVSKKALCMVGLEKRMKHRPSQMSGGQQQRVAVARAIAARPPVILADEPTGNLDSHSTAEIIQILKGLHKAGKTVIVITHDPYIACLLYTSRCV